MFRKSRNVQRKVSSQPKEDMDMQIINFLIKISGRKYEHKNNRNNYKKLHIENKIKRIYF